MNTNDRKPAPDDRIDETETEKQGFSLETVLTIIGIVLLIACIVVAILTLIGPPIGNVFSNTVGGSI
jgi:hypothetical protein